MTINEASDSAVLDTSAEETLSISVRTAELGGTDFPTALLQVLQNERFAPEILPYPSSTLDRAFKAINEQVAAAAVAAKNSVPTALPFGPADIHRMDAQRAQFLVSDLIRLRAKKIQKMCFAISHRSVDWIDILSQNELRLAQRIADMTHESMMISALGQLPPSLQLLVPNPPQAEGDEILPRVEVNRYVVALFLEDAGVIDLGGGHSQETRLGDILLAPYVVLKPLLITGKARLI